MAVIRVEVEVDSEVYPELYARLHAIERPASREERLRQLAASGLVWETVRLRGPGALPPPAEPASGALPPPAEPAPPPRRVRKRPAPQELPVLLDVVAEDEVSAPMPLDAARAAPQPDAPPLPPPLSTEVHPASPKSARVRRMLDRGLFKNG